MKSEKSEFTLWVIICAIIGLFIWQMPNIERLLFGRPSEPIFITQRCSSRQCRSSKVCDSYGGNLV